jgi:hypothetical protein
VDVIDGFRIEVTADELQQHLSERIQHHLDRAAECEKERIRLEAAGQRPGEGDDEEPVAVCWPGYLMELEQRAERHKTRRQRLAFLRDHIISREIYRLDESDLRLLEFWPAHPAMIAER